MWQLFGGTLGYILVYIMKAEILLSPLAVSEGPTQLRFLILPCNLLYLLNYHYAWTSWLGDATQMTGAILSATDKWGDVGKKGADARAVKQSKVHRKPSSGRRQGGAEEAYVNRAKGRGIEDFDITITTDFPHWNISITDF